MEYIAKNVQIYPQNQRILLNIKQLIMAFCQCTDEAAKMQIHRMKINVTSNDKLHRVQEVTTPSNGLIEYVKPRTGGKLIPVIELHPKVDDKKR